MSGEAAAADQGYLILSRQDPILQAMFGEQSGNKVDTIVETIVETILETKWKQ